VTKRTIKFSNLVCFVLIDIILFVLVRLKDLNLFLTQIYQK